MNPEEMNVEQLAEAIRREYGKQAEREARSERFMTPIKVKAPRRGFEVDEQATWWTLAGILAAAVVLSVMWAL